MNENEIRRSFLEFFASHGHTVIASDSLVPRDDPTLLFTGAGMNQFKEQFLGKNITSTRATTCQKCLRTGDLENVGKTAGHHTFFEMLGSFSFGDYFKEDAIRWAWEYLTTVLKIHPDKLWASVYLDDEEAHELWLKKVRLPAGRLIRLGAKDNFWPSNAPTDGPNGPCGPCSEIFYDWGEKNGCGRPSCDPSCDCGRFVEVWNLVFTQFDRRSDGSLEKLAHKNIDTGMGLERITAVMEGVRTNFEIDSFQPITASVIHELGRAHRREIRIAPHSPEINAIADHIRAITFAIADGVMPSNEGRGYVIRKLIRRSVLHSWNLAQGAAPFLFRIVTTVAETMKEPYPDLKGGRESIAQVVKHEEENFILMMENQGPHVLETFGEIAKKYPKIGERDDRLAKAAFNFYDTYGIPYDILEEFAEKKRLVIRKELFDALLNEQRERSRKSTKIHDTIFSETFEMRVKSLGLSTNYVGYERLSSKAKVTALFVDQEQRAEALAGSAVQILLDVTPFYGESGGQVGDRGTLSAAGGQVAVENVRPVKGSFLHIGTVVRGFIRQGDAVDARVDEHRRNSIMRNHTATHLLQNALRAVLGDHVRQAGSVVDDRHLRFDFTHPKKLDEAELVSVEELVNRAIKDDITVEIAVMRIEEAKRLDALALFGERYGETVRVISAGDSKELCGGTHVGNTSDIGLFVITGESSVASGVRRIEAVTYDAAQSAVAAEYRRLSDRFTKVAQSVQDASKEDRGEVEWLKRQVSALDAPTSAQAVTIDTFLAWRRKGLAELNGALEALEEIARRTEKQLEKEKLKSTYSAVDVDRLVAASKDVRGANVIMRRLDDIDMGALRGLVDLVRSKARSGVILLGSSKGENAYLVFSVTDDLIKRGIDAGTLIRQVASEIGGSGGGRPDFGQAGGARPAGLDSALSKAYELLHKELVR